MVGRDLAQVLCSASRFPPFRRYPVFLTPPVLGTSHDGVRVVDNARGYEVNISRVTAVVFVRKRDRDRSMDRGIHTVSSREKFSFS